MFIVNNCNVCVLCKIFFSIKLDLLEATSAISHGHTFKKVTNALAYY